MSESKGIKQSFRNFCDNTSIHGLKYIVEQNIHWIQRLLWVLVFLAGIGFSTYFCFQMWVKWDESPVLMSLDSNRYPLKNIPFPAVTICNVNKVSKEKLVKILQEPRYANISYDRMQNTLRYMTKLDRAINSQKELEILNQFYHSENITAKDLFQILKKTTPSCDELVIDCIWLGLPSPCMQYFSFLPSDDGICCTFNGANYSDPELGIQYSPNDVLKVAGNGYRMGLALVIDAKVDDYSVTNGKFDGFKVLVHSSEEFPDVNDRGFVIGPGSETFVAVKGITTFNTEEVAKEVSPAKRQCQVEEEHKLLYFPRYSRSACTIECAMKLMNDTCNCRPYFFRASNGTKLCELDSYNCISDVYESVRNNGDDLCHQCLPPCTDIWYEPEVSYAPFPGRGFNLTRTYKRLVKDLNLTVETDGNEYLKSNVAVLHVYYKDKTGMRYKTDIRFGVEDFISAMGGLLGLGLGVSFISLIEIVVYLIKNLVCFSCKTSSNKVDARDAELNGDKTKWPSNSTIATNGSTSNLPSSIEMQVPNSR